MKEKIIGITTLLGGFSGTITVLIVTGLEMVGVDPNGYMNIITIVAFVLSALAMIFGTVYINKYSKLQQKDIVLQKQTVTTALSDNAKLIQTMLPDIANNILEVSNQKSSEMLNTFEAKVNETMNEMLPNLAKQTMDLVTKQSQDIIDKTTAKAEAVMTSMDELLPTYAKNISDQVAQTVRENNSHVNKIITDIKKIKIPNIDTSAIIEQITNSVESQITIVMQNIEQTIVDNLSKEINKAKPYVQPIEVLTDEDDLQMPEATTLTTELDTINSDDNMSFISDAENTEAAKAENLEIDENSDESNNL